MMNVGKTILFAVVLAFIPAAGLPEDSSDAQKGDVAYLEGFFRDYYDALNLSDARGAESKWTRKQTASEYPRHGGLLETFPPRPLEEAAAALVESFERGLKLDLAIHHLRVEVYGDAAVATLYSSGTVTYPSGGTTGGIARVSYFLIRDEDDWKIVHMHSSPIRTGDGS